MRIKWKLKHELSDLRKEEKISLQKLAEEVFSTNTTLFRVEKTGVVNDEELAKQLAAYFNINFEEFVEKIDTSEDSVDEWEKQIKELFTRKPDAKLIYCLFFVTIFDQGKSYVSLTPTYWKAFADNNDSEIRNIALYEPNGIKEHLIEQGVDVAVAYDEMDLIYFYYGSTDEYERAIMVPKELAASVLRNFKEVKEIKIDTMINKYGFKDCCMW